MNSLLEASSSDITISIIESKLENNKFSPFDKEDALLLWINNKISSEKIDIEEIDDVIKDFFTILFILLKILFPQVSLELNDVSGSVFSAKIPELFNKIGIIYPFRNKELSKPIQRDHKVKKKRKI